MLREEVIAALALSIFGGFALLLILAIRLAG